MQGNTRRGAVILAVVVFFSIILGFQFSSIGAKKERAKREFNKFLRLLKSTWRIEALIKRVVIQMDKAYVVEFLDGWSIRCKKQDCVVYDSKDREIIHLIRKIKRERVDGETHE